MSDSGSQELLFGEMTDSALCGTSYDDAILSRQRNPQTNMTSEIRNQFMNHQHYEADKMHTSELRLNQGDVTDSTASHLITPQFSFVTCRPLREEDKEEIQLLHEDWFPVRYKNSFYESIVQNKMCKTGAPIFSLVATIRDIARVSEMANGSTSCSTMRETEIRNGENENGAYGYDHGVNTTDVRYDVLSDGMLHAFTKCGVHKHLHLDGSGAVDDAHTEDQSPLLVPLIEDQACINFGDRSFGAGTTTTWDGKRDHSEQIIGCVVGAFFQCDKVSSETTDVLIKNSKVHTKIFYIMTLGTVQEHRQRGLGSALVQQCVTYAQSDTRCGAAYLHVITYNVAAIRFYEKLGFVRVDEIQGTHMK